MYIILYIMSIFVLFYIHIYNNGKEKTNTISQASTNFRAVR